jgi:hypothetical protein
MAIVKDDLILASDVVETKYLDITEKRLELVGKSFESVNESWEFIYKLPPGQKHRTRYDYFILSQGEIKTTYYIRDVGTEDWTELSEQFDDTTVIHLNDTRVFKELRVVVRMFIDGGFGGVTNKTRIISETYIRPEIALQGELLRVMNIEQTAWENSLTLITVALYNTGRIGYE